MARKQRGCQPLLCGIFERTGPPAGAALRLVKNPAFRQGRFSIEQVSDLTLREIMNLLLSFIMRTMLEHRKG